MRVDFDDWVRENRVRFFRARQWLPPRRERIRRRPRDPDEYEVLFLLTRARWQRWVNEGKLELLGPRRFRLHPSASAHPIRQEAHMHHREVIQPEGWPAPRAPLSTAVRVGNLVFVSGTAALDPLSGAPLRLPFPDQVRQTLRNLQAILSAAGCSLADVVKTTVYLADLENFATLNEVYREFFPTDPPARTTIQATRLPLDFDLEIEAIAALPAPVGRG